jgi:hypothetical protein
MSIHWCINWCRFAFCDVPGSHAVCPPGMNKNEPCVEEGGCYHCPAHRDCYLSCSEVEWGSWIDVPGSPYNGKAFCERFPRGALQAEEQWQFLAQTGKSNVLRHNFDTVFSSIVTIFQILTGELLKLPLSHEWFHSFTLCAEFCDRKTCIESASWHAWC